MSDDLSHEPVERAVSPDGIHEVGVYKDDGWLTLVFYDYQGHGVLEIPEALAGPLSTALTIVAEGLR